MLILFQPLNVGTTDVSHQSAHSSVGLLTRKPDDLSLHVEIHMEVKYFL